jgi:hypothetical protein
VTLALTPALSGAARAGCAPDRVEFGTPGAPAAFTVEIADTPAERERGLMFRTAMAPDAGMIFVYPAPGHPYFWMKNTLIPLDMIFIEPSGRVARVKPMAAPGDLTAVDGGAGVQFVLEINGGLAERLGIGPGVAMRSALVPQAGAAWPCD